jgi:hypothetical protein
MRIYLATARKNRIVTKIASEKTNEKSNAKIVVAASVMRSRRAE